MIKILFGVALFYHYKEYFSTKRKPEKSGFCFILPFLNLNYLIHINESIQPFNRNPACGCGMKITRTIWNHHGIPAIFILNSSHTEPLPSPFSIRTAKIVRENQKLTLFFRLTKNRLSLHSANPQIK
jgi:hypothetical protein